MTERNKQTNKALGSRFERDFAERLCRHGFWVHLLSQNQAGQPADLLAVKNGKAYLIDCKVCSDGKFPLSRMEENQDLAMSVWHGCGNGEGWFALLLGEDIYMIPHITMHEARRDSQSLSEADIRAEMPLSEWIREAVTL